MERSSILTFGVIHGWLNKTMEAASEAQASTVPGPSLIDKILEHESAARLSEEVFAPLGKRVREYSEISQDTWLRLATGDGPNEKVFAVMVGYVVIGLALALYLNVLTVGSIQSAGRAVRNAVRQQLLVVKVSLPHDRWYNFDADKSIGSGLHYHRIGHFPIGLWYNA